MNPTSYFVALWPYLSTRSYSHPYTLQTSNQLDARSYQQAVLDVLRACPPPDVLSLLVQRWAYRPLGGWSQELSEDVWIRPPS